MGRVSWKCLSDPANKFINSLQCSLGAVQNKIRDLWFANPGGQGADPWQYSHLLLYSYLSFLPNLPASGSCLTSARSSQLGEEEEERGAFSAIFAQDEIIPAPGENAKLFPLPGAPDSSCCTGCTPLCWREARWARCLGWKAKAMLFLQPGEFSLQRWVEFTVGGEGRCAQPLEVQGDAFKGCYFLSLVTGRFFSLKCHI